MEKNEKKEKILEQAKDAGVHVALTGDKSEFRAKLIEKFFSDLYSSGETLDLELNAGEIATGSYESSKAVSPTTIDPYRSSVQVSPTSVDISPISYTPLEDEGVVPIVYDRSEDMKLYVLLITGEDRDGKEIRTFEIVEGRQQLYDIIKTYMEDEGKDGILVDAMRSKILIESNTKTIRDQLFGKGNFPAVTIYQFVKACYEDGLINDDYPLDIEEWNY